MKKYLILVLKFLLSVNILLISFFSIGQEINFVPIRGCVDFQPNSYKLIDCKTGKQQGQYEVSQHRPIQNLISLGTHYKEFQDLCGQPRTLRNQYPELLRRDISSDFICLNLSEKWIMFVRFHKLHSTLVTPLRIVHLSCVSMNYLEAIPQLERKFGKNDLSILNDDYNRRLFEERLRDVNRNDVVIYRRSRYSEEISASYVFSSSVHRILNCPGGVVLETNLEINPNLRHKIEREHRYQNHMQAVR
jgi:hypothetical protein